MQGIEPRFPAYQAGVMNHYTTSQWLDWESNPEHSLMRATCYRYTIQQSDWRESNSPSLAPKASASPIGISQRVPTRKWAQ